MLTLRRSEKFFARLLGDSRAFISVSAVRTQQPKNKQKDSEYTNIAQYPSIKDISFKAKKNQEIADWHEQIKHVPTVEEKMIKINMPRYYGYKVIKLSDERFPYNSLPATQHYTRTIFENNTKSKVESTEHMNEFVQIIKGDVTDAIEFAHEFSRYNNENKLDQSNQQQKKCDFAQLVVEQVNRALINALSADFPHLHELEVDYNPRHEAFWFVGGINPPKSLVKCKEGVKWQKETANDPVDRLFQYQGTPYLALRHRHQLPPWKSEADSVNPELAKSIPRYNLDPRSLGYVTDFQHGKNIPGFWPGSLNGFGCISYQSRAHMQIRPASYGPDDFTEVLHAQAIQSSFAWLLSQANYYGFNTVSDLTYPLNTQAIITNGRDWSFYEYQLNTLLIHTNQVDENNRVNYCSGTEELQLYQEIDNNGKCVGFNDEVLSHLIKFYKNTPSVVRSSSELTPYLNEKIRRIADYPNDEKRIFLENSFKHISANKPRHLELPEIYLWEKIYKIDNKTRPMEARRRFFELNINPWKRTLDQHAKEYIPKAVRPEGPRSRKKWKMTYYP